MIKVSHRFFSRYMMIFTVPPLKREIPGKGRAQSVLGELELNYAPCEEERRAIVKLARKEIQVVDEEMGKKVCSLIQNALNDPKTTSNDPEEIRILAAIKDIKEKKPSLEVNGPGSGL